MCKSMFLALFLFISFGRQFYDEGIIGLRLEDEYKEPEHVFMDDGLDEEEKLQEMYESYLEDNKPYCTVTRIPILLD